MPALAIPVLVLGGLWLVGKSTKDMGEGIDEAGNGALKMAGSVAVVAGVYLAGKHFKAW